MKRNLIIGIVLFGAVALSSCSTTKIASLQSPSFDDDVYVTKAKAGDAQGVVADNQMSYNTDDDYYYYGDYASRLNRFTTSSPFSYNDNFYYSYVPYNNGFGAGTEYDRDYYANYYGFGSQPNTGFLSNYVYSPYNYGYDPYDYIYDDYLYDDFGYGLAYSEFLFGGGGFSYYGTGRYTRNHSGYTSNITVPGTNPNARGARSGSSPGITRISALPGRPLVSINPTTGTVTRLNAAGINTGANNNLNNNTVNRQSRYDGYRPQTQSTNSAPAASSSSSGGSSAGAGGGGGGGGRPGRP